MNTKEINEIATEIAEILVAEQREIQGHFTDEDNLKRGALARLKYFVAEFL